VVSHAGKGQPVSDNDASDSSGPDLAAGRVANITRTRHGHSSGEVQGFLSPGGTTARVKVLRPADDTSASSSDSSGDEML